MSRVPDLLHHYYLGLIKKSIFQTTELLKGEGAGGKQLVQRLDAAIHHVGIRGLKTFAIGVLDMKGLKGWEYVDLAFLMIHALHEVDAPSELIDLFAAFTDLLIHLRLGEYSVRVPLPLQLPFKPYFFTPLINVARVLTGGRPATASRATGAT